MGHTLLCVLSLFLLNTLFYGKAEDPELKASLTADKTVIPAGGSVALTCSVNGSAGFTYEFLRVISNTHQLQRFKAGESDTENISQGGVYRCRGWRPERNSFTAESDSVTIQETVPVRVILQTYWSVIYSGEKITVRCEIQGGGGTGWTYEWRTPSSNNPPSRSEYTISRVTESHSGDYSCRGSRDYYLTEWSRVMRLTVSSDKPKATLRADTTTIPAGGSVSLTCSVDRSYSWKYVWFRRTSVSSKAQTVRDTDQPNTVITQGGVYTCSGRRGQPEFFTQESSKVTIKETVPSRVILQPHWSVIYSGEKITVRCEIQGGGDTEWTYEWRTPRSLKPSGQHEYTISRAALSHSGGYSCKGRSDYSLTEWSDVLTLTISPDKPKATLRADRTTIPAGGSVTLTCSVDGSDDWKYYGFRRDSHSAADPVRDVRGVMVVTEGGFYRCRGGRGDPEFFTQNSEEVLIQKTVSSRVTVTLQPNWSVIYSGEKITVRCEIQGGGGTGWTYEWRTTSSNNPPSHSEYSISRVTESHSGDYSCRGSRDYYLTEWSRVMRLTVSSNKPQASLTADSRVLPAGGSVTLTCSVNPSSGWKYYWYRENKLFEPLNTHDAVSQTTGTTSVSQEGLYRCRGERGDPVYYTQFSQSVEIDTIVPNTAVVTLQPNWPEIYRGETITVSCEIQGGDTEWTYEWEINSSLKPSDQHEYRISSASSSHSGDYRCRGRMKSAQHNTTEWSDSVKLTVYDNKPRPVLTVSPSWLSPGASVTLKCEVELPSAGWRFYWYKAVPDGSQRSYSYELLPGSSSGTEQDSYIVHGQTHTAGYVCKAGRGDPVIYTENSELKFVWSGDVRPSASLTVSPDRVQHFIYDSVSLSCEGNSTEWRVRRFDESKYLSHCSDFGIITGSTCNIYSYGPSDAVYWCESGSGEFSNTVNITLQNYYGIILLSPVRPVTEGESVTLGCKLRTEQHLSSVFFYQNDKLIQNDSRVELNISAVSQSDEGFYKCQSSGRESAQSWMSVKAVPRPESSSFPVWLIALLVCGVVLVLLLLLLFRFRQSKDSRFIRPIQSQSTSSTATYGVHQNEIRRNEYASPLNGDTCLYDTIRDSEDADNGESQDVTYSSIELKNIRKKKKHLEAAETSVYSDLKTGTDNSPMYAEVNIISKGKAKKKKGNSTPAATDETLYSEVEGPGKSTPAETDETLYSEVKKTGTSFGL
ncbi:basement membrane-specific heparan sulfate proteoglycan core protein-like isoform X2 [Seriola aureovittata]|uniref:basement membrane-specific heparan sulfate proteoglycan core protein-like isoform X2 n=1 Tax=Seriola aureovittata TaxID=2871759 RepID=UPI0024BE3AB4|nr:basement membrane-specific heparan sulfate proteoglycan core protein-like isoform X2 [Seriola aureovittata]